MRLKPNRVALISTASTIIVLTAIFLISEMRGLDELKNDQAQMTSLTTTIVPKSPDTPSNSVIEVSTVGGPKTSGKTADVETNYFAELLARADSGDAAAQFQAYTELIHCRGVESSSMIEQRINSANQLGISYADEYVDYLWSMHDKCASIPVDNFRQAAEHYLSLAEQANHPATLAGRLLDIADEQGFEATDELALQILQSNDPAAILRTTPYLLRRRTTLSLEQLQRTPSEKVLTAAIDIWVCNLDPPSCAPWSVTMYAKCYVSRARNCDPSEGYLDYQSHAVWSQDVEAEARRLARKWQSEVAAGKAPSVLTGETR